jgi:hypothetical protein
MISEDHLWDSFQVFRVNYETYFPYTGWAQRSGWMVTSNTAAPFIVGDPRFQVHD